MGDLTILRNSSLQILRANNRILRSTEGLYMEWEIDEMVLNGYIPVANGNEFYNVRNTGSRIMGLGTKWEGTYTTGTDKKYIQVRHVNAADFGPMPSFNFSGIYDGNLLTLFGFVWTAGFLGIFDLNTGTIKNINAKNHAGELSGIVRRNQATGKIQNCSIRYKNNTTVVRAGGGLCEENSGEIDNCVAIVDINSTGQAAAAGLVAVNFGTIKNCKTFGNIYCILRNSGGMIGLNSGTGAFVSNCHSYVNITVASVGVNSNCGGFVGYSTAGAKIEKSSAHGNATTITATASGNNCGGFVGAYETGSSLIIDCYSTGNVSCANSMAGGFSGWTISGAFTNCYSMGAVSGVSNVGGFSGLGAGTMTNCYYDKDTSGKSDTGKGLPRTTAQMKEGTASSFILPAGGTDPGSLAANAMYTSWDTAIWDFLTTADYPILK